MSEERATAGQTVTLERASFEGLHHVAACHTNGVRALCGADVAGEPWCNAARCGEQVCVVCHDLDQEHDCGCPLPLGTCRECDG